MLVSPCSQGWCVLNKHTCGCGRNDCTSLNPGTSLCNLLCTNKHTALTSCFGGGLRRCWSMFIMSFCFLEGHISLKRATLYVHGLKLFQWNGLREKIGCSAFTFWPHFCLSLSTELNPATSWPDHSVKKVFRALGQMASPTTA